MALPVPGDGRITRERYWRLVEEGVIGPDDRVELLEGVIVSMSPQNPPSRPTSALLVVDVADGTMLQDRMTKGPMYAAAGVGEYWLVNLRARAVETYHSPIREQRRYGESRIARGGDRLTVATLPGLSIGVAEILPPA